MILSKGHAAPVLYSVLARRGFFDPALLPTLRQMGSPLQGHPHMEKLAGLDCSSGSLGQGLSVANGLALAAKRLGKDYRTYCLMGDGEVQEGQVWEAAMTAAHFGLEQRLRHRGRQRRAAGRPDQGHHERGAAGREIPGLWLACDQRGRP